MNWERGLLRLWLLASALWVIGAGSILFGEIAESLRAWSELGLFLPEAPLGAAGEPASIDYLRRTGALVRIGALAAVLFGPPAATLLLGVVLAWMLGSRTRGDTAADRPKAEQRGGTDKMGRRERGDGGDL